MIIWLTIVNIVLIAVLVILVYRNPDLEHRNLLIGLIVIQIILIILNILLQCL